MNDLVSRTSDRDLLVAIFNAITGLAEKLTEERIVVPVATSEGDLLYRGVPAAWEAIHQRAEAVNRDAHSQYPETDPIYGIWEHEDVIPPEMKNTVKDTKAKCYFTGGTEPKILYGYILYTDVFKTEIRRCSWGHRIYRNGNSEPLEGCYSDWS